MPIIWPQPPEPSTNTDLEFYLGTHHDQWLWFTDMPKLFISQRRLSSRRYLRPALTNWALDSGGFSELSLYGGWATGPHEYIADIRRYMRYMGRMEWAAPQDKMCEPQIIHRTGDSVQIHLEDTIDNFRMLTHLAPDINFIPVIQGYKLKEYETCIKMYYDQGIALPDYPVTGVGSICRRQSTGEIREIVSMIQDHGIRIHAFGVSRALGTYANRIVSADSMAWSREARSHPERKATNECRTTHKNCANCLPYALQWRSSLLDPICGVNSSS